jgi:hypothetical protein
MYNRELETNAEKHAEHIRNLMKNAAARLANVAAKKKLKKDNNKKK